MTGTIKVTIEVKYSNPEIASTNIGLTRLDRDEVKSIAQHAAIDIDRWLLTHHDPIMTVSTSPKIEYFTED